MGAVRGSIFGVSLLAAMFLGGAGVQADEFDTFVAQGKDAITLNLISDAMGKFGKALELRPAHPEALYGVGYCAQLQGKSKTALKHFYKVLEVTYRNPQERDFHSLAVSRIGEILMAQGDAQGAMEIFSRGVQNDPDSPMMHYGYGLAMRASGKNEKALMEFEETLRLDPKHSGGLVGKASIYYSLGDVPNAFSYLQEAIAANPESALPYGVMSRFYEDLEKPYEQHMMLGRYYFNSGSVTKAADEFRIALAIKDNAEAYHAMGAAELRTGALKDSEEHLRKAISLKIKPADSTWSHLAQALARQGKLDEAIKANQKAIRINKKEPAYRAQAAWIALMAGDIEEAEKAAKLTLEMDPESAVAMRYLGDVSSKKGRYSEAVINYEKALARSPSLADVYVNLGWAYEKLGDEVMARKNYETFLRLAPDPETREKVEGQIKKLKRKNSRPR